MNVSRLVNLVAAIVISGMQWTAFLGPVPYTKSVREVAAPDSALPVVVVTGHRLS